MILYHIFIPVIAAIIMNGIIYTFQLNNYSTKKINPYLPPGYIIGIVWIFILGLLGYAHYLLYDIHKNINIGSISIALLILFCILYPLITGLREKSGLLMNLISLILSFIVSLIVITYSKYIFLYIIPLIIWVSYVNIVCVIECSKL